MYIDYWHSKQAAFIHQNQQVDALVSGVLASVFVW